MRSMLACGGSDGSPSPAFAGLTVSMRSLGPGPCLMIVQVLALCCSSLEQFCMCELEDHVEIGLGWCSCSHLELQSPTTNSDLSHEWRNDRKSDYLVFVACVSFSQASGQDEVISAVLVCVHCAVL